MAATAGAIRVVLRAAFAIVLGVLCGLVLSTSAHALPLPPPSSAALPGSAFQGADGDQAPAPQLVPPLIDWATLAQAVPPRVERSPDPNPDDTFKPGSKELEPEDWDFVVANAGADPAKANILDAWSSVDEVLQQGPPPATDTFLYLAFAREAGASSAAFLTFELNRDSRLWENRNGVFIPCRRDGDLLITFVPEGNALRIYVKTWRTLTAGTFGCGATGELSSAANVTANTDIQGAFNIAGSIANALGGSAGPTLGQFQFGETALNLGRVIGLPVGSTCAFTSFWMHSRSSPSVTSNMTDFVAPRAIDARRCSASGTKYLDSNANGRRDGGEPALSGWRVYADLNGNGRFDDGTEPFAITDQHGHYTIDDSRLTGTYTLREEPTSAVPLAGPWTCSDPSPCEHVVNAAVEPNAQGRNFGNWRPALLTLRKQLSPTDDPGRFNLAANASATTVVPNAGNGTSRTFSVRPTAAGYTVSETAAAGTNAGDYESSVDCAPVTRLGRRLRGATASTGPLLAGEHVECTFVNTRLGTPAVTLRKVFVAPIPAVHGDTLQFQLAVTNTSSGSHSFPAAAVHVTDDRCTPSLVQKLDATGAEDPSPGSLDPLDAWIYECRVTTGPVDPDTCRPTTLDNTGHVIVAPGVSAEDSAQVDLRCPVTPQPAVAIQKLGPATAQEGSALRYVFFVRNIGEVPFAQAHVTVSDPACDAAPELVARFDAAGEPDTSSPAVLSPGAVWEFTCTNSTPALTASCQPSVVTNTGTVVATSDGHGPARDSDDFETPLTCAPGPPAPQPQPEAPPPAPQEPPGAVPPPAAGVAGTASISPIRGCLRRGSRVVIVGSRIADVTVTVGGRRVGGLRVALLRRRAIIRIVGNLPPGRHRATVTVRFQRGAATPTVRHTRTVSICAAPTEPPFTG